MAPGNTAKNSNKQQQQQILLKFNIKTNEIISPPANSLGTNRAGGGKTYMYWTVTQGSSRWTKQQQGHYRTINRVN